MISEGICWCGAGQSRRQPKHARAAKKIVSASFMKSPSRAVSGRGCKACADRPVKTQAGSLAQLAKLDVP